MTLPPDIVSVLIYGALALAGYVLRHVNLFRHAAPGPLTQYPLLNQLTQQIDAELRKSLDDAIKRLMKTNA